MKQLSLEQIKKIETEILIYIDSFCRENKIDYSLCYGSALGAVRHGGIIPWDDDIDIMMTRENYQRFVDLFPKNNKSKYKLLDENSKNYNYMFAKVFDSSTILQDENVYRYDAGLGVFVDIMPIDFLGETFDEAKKNFERINYYKYKLVASNWKKFFINKNHNFIRQLVRLYFYLTTRFSNPKKIINKINKIKRKFYPKEHTKFCGFLFGAYGLRDIYESLYFDDYTRVAFENRNFMIINNIDLYLTKVYGDYMKLPPEEKRINRHYFSAFLKNYDK